MFAVLSVAGSATAMMSIRGVVSYSVDFNTLSVVVPVSGVVSGFMDVVVAVVTGVDAMSMCC